MTLSISDMMTKKLETVQGTASVQEAARKMKDKNVSSLIVVDGEGKPQGLVTERDLVRKVCIKGVRTRSVTNKEIMSSPLITIDSSSTASIAVGMMLQNNIRHLLVVDKSDTTKPIGIITPLDLRLRIVREAGGCLLSAIYPRRQRSKPHYQKALGLQQEGECEMTSQSMSNNLALVTLHDAAPSFSKRIFEFTDALENLGINFNVGVVPFYHHKEDLPRFPEFVDKLKSYKRCELVLHGLYHEDTKGQFDDFSHKTQATIEQEIRAALEIFQEVGIKSNVFVPPQWKLSSSGIKVLGKLGFGLTEMQEEFFLLSQKPFRKIKVPKVLSWDLTGYPEQNIVRIGTEERCFRLLDEEQGRKMIRIALHPRDSHRALEYQLAMIRKLKDQGYTILLYQDLIQKLQHAPYTTICQSQMSTKKRDVVTIDEIPVYSINKPRHA
jgi:CBS domain-containing protein/predicted deacetylase